MRVHVCARAMAEVRKNAVQVGEGVPEYRVGWEGCPRVQHGSLKRGCGGYSVDQEEYMGVHK